MSLAVHMWIYDSDKPGGWQIPDAPEEVSEAAGPEVARTILWGSEAARGLDATFLPQLAERDLRVQPDDVEVFAEECAVLMANLAVLSAASGFDEDRIRAYLRNFVSAVERARQVGGGVLIW
ncbi:hypothetical protein KZZ52_59200 [Dactylosporangium sp. AC04546]|uniref:hypothetical protein n=1 Tax=Dactylosporangium sp. AC04546 TaxID=2862460 RepID=UPI001EDE7E91|nr:hypothetical protein [Dactylosporangium sp. AC04546]WVK83715.1 hypothetical protein KZZ52_59200 [Dactylosporangium sp. AC04546]